MIIASCAEAGGYSRKVLSRRETNECSATLSHTMQGTKRASIARRVLIPARREEPPPTGTDLLPPRLPRTAPYHRCRSSCWQDHPGRQGVRAGENAANRYRPRSEVAVAGQGCTR